MLFSMCPLEFFRAIRATFWSPGGLEIFETSNLPASGSIIRLDPANETSAPHDDLFNTINSHVKWSSAVCLDVKMTTLDLDVNLTSDLS